MQGKESVQEEEEEEQEEEEEEIEERGEAEEAEEEEEEPGKEEHGMEQCQLCRPRGPVQGGSFTGASV